MLIALSRLLVFGSFHSVLATARTSFNLDPTRRLTAVTKTLFNMVKPAHTPPASPRSSVVRKHFDKTPDSPGDELLAAAVFRGVPNEGRTASKTLRLQVHNEDHDEDQSSLDFSSMKSASSRHTGKTWKQSQVSPISPNTG